jgi:hypothetical protein
VATRAELGKPASVMKELLTLLQKFESITTEMKVDHVQVYTVKRPALRVGQTITIHYELQTKSEA